MLNQPVTSLSQIQKFYSSQVLPRKRLISSRIQQLMPIVQDILKEVEGQEPRFISTLHETSDGRYFGLRVQGPCSFTVVLYLNQMGVFNFVDDGSTPGCAVLKLSDGRKRSMSLWVEFITASGYLSSRKIRARFRQLVASAVDRSKYQNKVSVVPNTTDVVLRIYERYKVQITPAFRCAGIWPRSAASRWPSAGSKWPPDAVMEAKSEGFDLTTKERRDMWPTGTKPGPCTAAGDQDAWIMEFTNAEDSLLSQEGRKMTVSVLKTLRDLHFHQHMPNNPISTHMLKSVVLHESDKHPIWSPATLPHRLAACILHLVHRLTCGTMAHYFLPDSLDLLRGHATDATGPAARVLWRLFRDLVVNPRALEAITLHSDSELLD